MGGAAGFHQERASGRLILGIEPDELEEMA
jgi:hypothetical protein